MAIFCLLASPLSLFHLFSTSQQEWSWGNLCHTSLQISPMASYHTTSESPNPCHYSSPQGLSPITPANFVSPISLIFSPFLTLCSRSTGLCSLINTVSLIYFSFAVSSARILPADFWTLIHSFISFRPFYKYYLLPRPPIPTHNSFSIPLSNFIFL